jgi:ubiquinone/menaquinone biosynthesis C-methylase UbiE
MSAIERYDPKDDNGSAIGEEHIARYEFAARFVGGKKVLDIACGAGYGSAMISEAAKEVIGVDLDKKSIEQARANYKKANLSFISAPAEKIPFPDQYFDMVVSFETIEHLDNDRIFLSEIKRVLKKGGELIISTPNRKIVSCYLIYHQPFNIYHKREYLKNEFINLIKDFFSIKEILGQRFIFSCLTNYIIRKIIERICRLVRPRWERKIFYEADVASVKPLKLGKTASYFIIRAKKNE